MRCSLCDANTQGLTLSKPYKQTAVVFKRINDDIVCSDCFLEIEEVRNHYKDIDLEKEEKEAEEKGAFEYD